jgi:hypothetical protein
MQRRALGVLIAALIGILPAVPALAGAPVITNEFDVQVVDNLLLDCGSFDVIENAHITGIEKTFYNRDGDPVRSQLHFRYDGTFTNSATGKSFSDRPDPQLYVYDYATDTLAVKGLIVSINVPGQGVVLLDAGNIIFDVSTSPPTLIFESARHDATGADLGPDAEAFCAALQ